MRLYDYAVARRRVTMGAKTFKSRAAALLATASIHSRKTSVSEQGLLILDLPVTLLQSLSDFIPRTVNTDINDGPEHNMRFGRFMSWGLDWILFE